MWTRNQLPATVPTILVICAVLAWWFTEPKSVHLNLIVLIGCLLFYWAIAPELAQETPVWLYQNSITLATLLRLDVLVLYHANMLVTGAAVLWLAHRAWQTLWKPVPELIGILGVDVPDPPDVSLAGIRADAATLNWTRPHPNRPVAKFLIQVNGVNVGESANQETAITVTGLKPNHFYNVRVIAVGYNNFQAGSRVIRLRTFARDGRPQLGDGRLPSNFVPEEQQQGMATDRVDEDGVSRGPAAGVETISVPEITTPITREPSISSGPRRNTLTRKHSPSTTSMDQSVKDTLSNFSGASLQELGEKFQSIRKEIDETQAQIAKDEAEYKQTMDELAEEKKLKRRLQKEKDDTTEKLKRELGSTDRAMRSAQQRKTQKEKLLREKQNERKKLEDDMAKWEKDIASMQKRQACFEKEKRELQENTDAQAEELRAEIALLQASCAQEEAELKEKSKVLKEAEEQRKKLPGGEESEEWRESERQLRRDWDTRARDLQRRLYASNRKLRMVNDYEQVLQAQLAAAHQSGLPFMYNEANTSAVEVDPAVQNQIKRRSRNSSSLSNVVIPSPATTYSAVDRGYPAPTNFGASRAPTIPPGFAPGPFMDHAADFSGPADDEGLRALTAGAPLSPTATALLPAGMLEDLLDDDEPSSPGPRRARQGTFGQEIFPEKDPQSPVSSGRSISIMSSPHGSAHHLPFPQFPGENSERRPLKGHRGEFGPASSPLAQPTQSSSRRTFLPWLHRGPKPADEPPALGTLKPAQSNSFPRQTGELETNPNKRRISFSTSWNMFHRGPAAPPAPDAIFTSPGSNRFPFGMNKNGSGILSELEPSSPRPPSIASSEIRPSTDSGSIWARMPQPSRIWSPEDNPWGSRNPSRRPSIHGSPSALKTTLADADDEILDESELMHASPSQVGVIGTKPSTAKSLSQRLNPAAPSFMGGFFRARPDKTKEANRDTKDQKDKFKNKGKAKGTKEREGRASVSTASEAAVPSADETPSESRQSRDTFSVDTPSMSESRDSLNLDQAFSNTASDSAAGLEPKEEASGFKKLLRKGSSSKFSLSSVRGLAGKKGPGSATNSDRNMPTDRTSFDELAEDMLGRSYDSVASSPSVGPLSGTKPVKEKGVNWGRFTMKRKPGKEKESLDLDRSQSSPTTASPNGDEK
ncbi:hypothetical protein DL769_004879 [Monosporascus sp. CRB-8-3]|nr:hypothetical protein DL769_004879 [Monosporascus sp. CRB-8-3]